ncbi:MAG TPA: hypothetical protein VHX20_12165 [Terracidiphilus sp.]|jgi:hypothetical protein|nr:hypothetical protein [Terracidiphilus sp.]
MNWKGMAVFVLLGCVTQWAQGASTAAGQESGQSAPAVRQTDNPRPAGTVPAPAPIAAAAQGQIPAQIPARATPRPYVAHPYAAHPTPTPAVSATPAPSANCESGPCDYQPAHISIATPAPAPAPWSWQDRIAWVANLALVILAYAAIFVALSLLKKIDRQTQYAESAAQAASETAQAVMQHIQAAARAERPWVLVTVEQSRGVENGFMVVAANRGRSPARILSAVDRVTIEANQNSLPEVPEYADAHPNAALSSVILLPGESTGIKPFGRDDVREVSGTEERLKRIEQWEEVILLYGKIVYQDLVAEGEAVTHETGWCSWYIHGRLNSGMVMAGSPPYNRHT